MTAARRLAAILAIDVVGNSRLLSEDEAGGWPRRHSHGEIKAPAGESGRPVRPRLKVSALSFTKQPRKPN
jgi:hypothetical protein